MNGWLQGLLGLELRAPAFLSLALALPLLLWLRRRRGEPALPFAPFRFVEDGSDPLPATWRTRLAWLPLAIGALGFLLLTLALAQPIARVPLPPSRPGIDLMLCLDTSSSMAATDLAPDRTRLHVSKDAAAAFVTARPTDRLGLCCFARFADLRCPPTQDHDALLRMLHDVAMVERDSNEDATGIGTAVARAAQVLRGSQAKSKVIVLLTDGEENVASPQTPQEIAPAQAAQLCAQLGIRAYVIAAGTTRVDAQGRAQPLDTTAVRELAARTGGRFFAAGDAATLTNVYQQIDDLERTALDEARYRIDEQFLWCLVPALSLLLIGWLLRATVLAVLP